MHSQYSGDIPPGEGASVDALCARAVETGLTTIAVTDHCDIAVSYTHLDVYKRQIMLYLIQKGVDYSMAFKIMESVRKGKGLTEEMETAMSGSAVPEWYIEYIILKDIE